MREHKPINLRDMAAAYALAYPVATVASVRVFLREHGLEATEYRESRLLRYLHHKHGWRLDWSLCKAALHRAPESTVEDCLEFCTRQGIALRSVEGELEIKRAAKECGVVKGYRWYYYGLPF